MAVRPITVLPQDAGVLRSPAKRVREIDKSIYKLVEDMIDSMYAANGVGLAAPQIGVSLRVVVIGVPGAEPFALINPEIVKTSGERELLEGCLSVPGYRGTVLRSSRVVAKAIGVQRQGCAHPGRERSTGAGAGARDQSHQRHPLHRSRADAGRSAATAGDAKGRRRTCRNAVG